ARQGLQWNELHRPRDGGQNEPGEVVEDRPRDQLAKGAGIVSVGSVQSRKIPIPLALLNDGRWIAEANKQEVHQQPPDATIAVEERMDPLEGSMVAGEDLADRRLVARSRADSVDPISDQRGDLGVVGRLHSPTEGIDVVPAPVPRPLVI